MVVSWKGLVGGIKRMEIGEKDIILIANGDSRRAANLAGQAAQMNCEGQLGDAFLEEGYTLVRAHPEVDPVYGHGFIENMAQGRDVFSRIPRESKVVVAEAVWQFSHHVAPYLQEHEGPILIASNFDGTWPGLVGALGLRACLAKQGTYNSLLWSSEGFGDGTSRKKMGEWLKTEEIEHDLSHVHSFIPIDIDCKEHQSAIDFGKKAAEAFYNRPRIIGIYDPRCMGMLNAAFDERDMVGTGMQLMSLNQSDLFARMEKVTRGEAMNYIKWLVDNGFHLKIGPNPYTDVTERMVEDSGRMYGAIVRHVAEERLDGIGIAYQLGLANLCASSDLPEAMLNSSARPPVKYEGGIVMPGEPIMCANEADMGCAVDQAMSNLIYKSSGLEQMWWETTQHDLRWGAPYSGRCKYNGIEIDLDSYVWVFELSGNTPAGHMENGWADLTAVRQPYGYFPEGGIATKGTTKAGEIIWSRVYIENGERYMDIGRGAAVVMPEEETQRRWDATTKEWPLMHAITYGVTRDQLMAKHRSNHVTVSYAPDAATANEIMFAKAGMAYELGFKVNVCGGYALKNSLEYAARSDSFTGPSEA